MTQRIGILATVTCIAPVEALILTLQNVIYISHLKLAYFFIEGCSYIGILEGNITAGLHDSEKQ